MQYPSETIEAITRFLFIGKPLQELSFYDLVIVLGNDDITGTVRELQAIRQKGCLAPECHIILSGNVGALNQGKAPEAERLFKEATEQGMPEGMFWVENRATNALENFRYSMDIVQAHGGFDSFVSILCVGRAFMTRRAKMCAVACGYPVEKLSFYGTVDHSGRNIGPDTWWFTQPSRVRVLEELARIANYSLTGDISMD